MIEILGRECAGAGWNFVSVDIAPFVGEMVTTSMGGNVTVGTVVCAEARQGKTERRYRPKANCLLHSSPLRMQRIDAPPRSCHMDPDHPKAAYLQDEPIPN